MLRTNLFLLPSLASAGYYDRYSQLDGSSHRGTDAWSDYSTIDGVTDASGSHLSTKPFMPAFAAWLDLDKTAAYDGASDLNNNAQNASLTLNIIPPFDQVELKRYDVLFTTSPAANSAAWTGAFSGGQASVGFSQAKCDNGVWEDDPWPRTACDSEVNIGSDSMEIAPASECVVSFYNTLGGTWTDDAGESETAFAPTGTCTTADTKTCGAGKVCSWRPNPIKVDIGPSACDEVVVVPVYFGGIQSYKTDETTYWSLATPIQCPQHEASCKVNDITCSVPTLWQGISTAGTIVASTNSQKWEAVAGTDILYQCGYGGGSTGTSFTVDKGTGAVSGGTAGTGCLKRDFNGTMEGGGDATGAAGMGDRRHRSLGHQRDAHGKTLRHQRLEWLREWVTLTTTTNPGDPRFASDVIPRDVFCYCKTPLYADVTTSPVQSWYVTLNPYGGSLASEAETAMAVTLTIHKTGGSTYGDAFTLDADKGNTLPKTTTKFYLQAMSTTNGIQIQASDVAAARTSADAITPGPNRLILAGQFCDHPQFDGSTIHTTNGDGEGPPNESAGSDTSTHKFSFAKFRFLGQPEVYFAARIRACQASDTQSCADQYDMPACDTTAYPTTDLGARVTGDGLNSDNDTNFNYRGRRLQASTDQDREFIAMAEVAVSDESPTVQELLNPATKATTGAESAEAKVSSNKKPARTQQQTASTQETSTGSSSTMILMVVGGVFLALTAAMYAYHVSKKTSGKTIDESHSVETGRSFKPTKEGNKYASKVDDSHDVL